MSPLILATETDNPYDVEVAGVGTLGGNGRGGFTFEHVAQTRRVTEFLDEDGEPLTGKKLEDAGRAFAKGRGLRVRSQKTVDEQALREEGGAFPAGPSIEAVSAEYRDRLYGQAEAAADAEGVIAGPDDLPPQNQITETPGEEG